jgi:uncharacterized Fe-S cluster-containing protein
MKKIISTDAELDDVDMRKLEAFARKLEREKKAKAAQEAVPPEKRVYVMDIKIDSIMTSRSGALGMKIKGKKECEYLLRQLERRYGRKFYMEEVLV